MRTKSTESMPFIFSFMMVIVSFLWLCYGTVVEDVNIQVKMPYTFITVCLTCTCSFNLFPIWSLCWGRSRRGWGGGGGGWLNPLKFEVYPGADLGGVWGV